MNRIDSRELPSWFDIAQYSETANLDLFGWYLNLTNREQFHSGSRTNPKEYQEEFELFVNGADSLVQIAAETKNRSEEPVRQEPILDDWQTKIEKLVRITVRSLPVSYCVMTIAEANEMHTNLAVELWDASKTVRVGSEGWDGDIYTNSYDEELEIHEFMHTPIDLLERRGDGVSDDPRLQLQVDMFAPDSMIIEDFKQWLKGARSVFNMPTKNLFSDANMASWARNQILAFIDLNIWARYEGVTITDAVMGNTLFPDEIDIDATERIRKTIRAKADYLMRPSVISAIYKQHHCCPVNFHSKGI